MTYYYNFQKNKDLSIKYRNCIQLIKKNKNNKNQKGYVPIYSQSKTICRILLHLPLVNYFLFRITNTLSNPRI